MVATSTGVDAIKNQQLPQGVLGRKTRVALMSSVVTDGRSLRSLSGAFNLSISRTPDSVVRPGHHAGGSAGACHAPAASLTSGVRTSRSCFCVRPVQLLPSLYNEAANKPASAGCTLQLPPTPRLVESVWGG